MGNNGKQNKSGSTAFDLPPPPSTMPQLDIGQLRLRCGTMSDYCSGAARLPGHGTIVLSMRLYGRSTIAVGGGGGGTGDIACRDIPPGCFYSAIGALR